MERKVSFDFTIIIDLRLVGNANKESAARQRDRSVGAILNYKLDFAPVIDGLPALLLGCLGTLWLALAGMALAIVIGIGGVILRDSRIKLLRWLVIGFVELIRNTPFLVQIYFIFFALPLAGVRLDPTPTAIIALGVNGGAYAIEIIRGGVQSINKGQVEAGLALGLHKLSVFRFIVLKPACARFFLRWPASSCFSRSPPASPLPFQPTS